MKGLYIKRVTLYIPEVILELIAKAAIAKKLPYSQLIRAAIWEHLKKERLIGPEIMDDLTLQAQCFVKK